MRNIARALLLSAVTACVVGAAAAPAFADPTVVTFGFDDGTADQYAQRQVLDDHDVHGTFYVNSGTVGSADAMTWTQLQALQADGNEIGGHTISHANLETLVAAAPDQATAQTQLQHEICDDRTALTGHGLTVDSFAFPNGAWGHDDVNTPGSKAALISAALHSCGYTSARTTEGIDPSDCDLCTEPLPILSSPIDRHFRSRSLQILTSPTADTEMIDALQAAHDNGGGWLQFVLHDICDDACGGNYTLTPTQLETVLDWLVAHAHDGDGYQVATVHQVVTNQLPAWNPTGSTGGDTGGGSAGGGTPATGGGGSGGASGPTTPAPSAAPSDPAPVDPPAATPAAVSPTAAPVAAALTPPTVRLLTVSRGRDRLGAWVLIRASVHGGSSAIARVEFLVGGKVVGVDRGAPYALRWRPPASRHTRRFAISARVVDQAGQRSAASRRSVSVAPAKR